MTRSIDRIAADPRVTLAKKMIMGYSLAVYASASVYTERDVAWNCRWRRCNDWRVELTLAKQLLATDETLNCRESCHTDWKLVLTVAEPLTATVWHKLVHATATGLQRSAMAMLLLQMWGQANVAPDLSLLMRPCATPAEKLLAETELAAIAVTTDTMVSESVVMMMAEAHSKTDTMKGQACNTRW